MYRLCGSQLRDFMLLNEKLEICVYGSQWQSRGFVSGSQWQP